MDWLLALLASGIGNLASYLAAHVLLCLLPAFFIAGAMTALIPKPSITRFLGRSAKAHVSYPAAAAAGSLLAVCSCTIVPLFAGIYRKGAGLGPAMTFLFFAPAGNIMALAYTGSVLGAEFAVARIILALLFGIGIGLLMALGFRHDDAANDQQTSALFSSQASMGRAELGLVISLVAVLLTGTAKLWPLTVELPSVHVPAFWAMPLSDALGRWVPFDASRGEEGVSVQGALLISLLLLIGLVAWRGLEPIIEGANRLTWLALGLAALTLLVATLHLAPVPLGLRVAATGRTLAVLGSLSAVTYFSRDLEPGNLNAFLWESWRFVKQIFPLLVVGVFLVGVARPLISAEWIQSLAGENTLLGNAVAVVFGVFMYFPTLVEVPVAHMFLDLGMHRGPLLAYLMSDPELSLQSILMTAGVIGRRKAFAYVGWVALFSMLSGLLYGAYVDGMSLVVLGLVLVGLVACVSIALVLARRLRPSAAEQH